MNKYKTKTHGEVYGVMRGLNKRLGEVREDDSYMVKLRSKD